MLAYTLRQLTYFTVAAQRGGIAEAASTLHVSQPSVSSAIAKLEQQLGVQLLIRHHAQGVSLTPSGRRLLADAQSLLRHAEEFQQRALATGTSIAGQLDVGCFVTIAAVYMPRLITGFTQQHPDAQIRLHEGNRDEIIEGLESGRIEVALVYDVGLSQGLHFELLAELNPYAILPKDHRLARKPAVRLDELRGEPFILLDIPPSREYFPGLFRDAGLEPEITFSSPSFEMVRGMVGRGAGYSLLVTRPYSDYTYDGRQIIARRLATSTRPARVGLTWRSSLRATGRMQAFTDYCKETFAALRRVTAEDS